MAKTYNKLLMDVNGKIGNIVTEVQGDQNSRYLDISLFNNGIPIDLTGHTVRIYMRRPHTNPLEEFFNDGEITEATRGRCQFLLSTQALAKECELEAQVSIWKGTEEILSTQVFKIMVTKKLRTNGSVESSNEYGALVVLFQNLYEAHDLMTTMVQNIGNPSNIAAQYNLATMWQAWEFLTDYMKTDLTNMIEQALENASVQGVLDKIGTDTDTGDTTVFGKLNHKSHLIYVDTLPQYIKVQQTKTHLVSDSDDTLLNFDLVIPKDMYFGYVSISLNSNNTRNYLVQGEIQILDRTLSISKLSYKDTIAYCINFLGDFTSSTESNASLNGNNHFRPLMKAGSIVSITTKKYYDAAYDFNVTCTVHGTSFE